MSPASTWAAQSLATARPGVAWLDDPARPARLPALHGTGHADLVVVGGGYTGLWAALRAKERDPGREVVLLEAGGCGDQASGRNGGFASASLTHGFGNGMERWPEELAELDRLGAENLRAIGDTVRRHDIDCGFEETGELLVATAEHQVEELAELAAAMGAAGHDVRLLDGARTRAEVDSPTYLGGLLDAHGTAMVEPARLAWGLRDACLRLGVRIHEGSVVTGLDRDGVRMAVRTRTGRVVAPH
ncbi:MAG: NAD(P)/FAD-dependent oxidoreductase, partial [Nocardioides sp.]